MPLDLLERDALPANATRYDLFRASPSPATLQTMWLAWAFVSELSAVACALVILALLCDRRARQSPFNLYVIFVSLPDFLFSFLCGITCAYNYSRGGFFSDEAMCEFQAWYCIFGFTASPWLNACIAYELHGFLKSTTRLVAFRPPTRRRVIVQAMCVYAFAAFVASWTLFGRAIPSMPHRANAAGGMACLPVEFSVGSTLFFWLLFVPTFIGAPLVYIVYVAVHTWRHKLISPRRSTASRQAFSLAMYFLRIFICFLVMWVPTIILIYVFDLRLIWLGWAGGTWSHLQGLVAVLLTLTKRDVLRAVATLVCCGRTPPSLAGDAGEYHGTKVQPSTASRVESATMAEQAFTVSARESAEPEGGLGFSR